MRLEKKIKEWVNIPETWVDDAGNEYNLGPGRVKICSLTESDMAKIRRDSGKAEWSVVNGEMRSTMVFDEVEIRELSFARRIDGWESGFQDSDGKELNCTEKNKRAFAWVSGLYEFVIKTGTHLDKIAKDQATDEEKNFIASLTK